MFERKGERRERGREGGEKERERDGKLTYCTAEIIDVELNSAGWKI